MSETTSSTPEKPIVHLTAEQRSALGSLFTGRTDRLILRKEDLFQSVEHGSDVDILCRFPDEVKKDILHHIGTPVWVARRSYVTSYFYGWCHLDVMPSVEWRGAALLSNERLFGASRVGKFGVLRPSLAHDAIIVWFSSILWGGFFKESYRPAILEAVAQDPGGIQSALSEVFGSTLGNQLWRMAQSERFQDAAPLKSRLRKSLWLRQLAQHPARTLRGGVRFFWAELGLTVQPPLPMIAVLTAGGFDTQGLIRELKSRPSRTLLGFDIIEWVKNTLKPWSFLRRIATARAKNKIVVLTQTSAAFLQNNLDRPQGPWNFLNKILSGGTPQPDLFLVVMKSPQDHEGLEAVERLPGACILDGGKPQHELVDTVILEIHKLLQAKASRHIPGGSMSGHSAA